MSNEFKRGFKTWCEQVAVQQRRELGLQDTDPIDPAQYASHLGVLVWPADQIPGLKPETRRVLFDKDRGSWSAATLTVGRTVLVILNHTHPQSRQNSSLVHELSHILLDHKPARVDVTEDELLILNTYDRKQEDEANWLTGCLLLPRQAVVSLSYKGLTDDEAAEKYGVSRKMIQYRKNVTGAGRQYQRMRRQRRGENV